MIEPGSLDLDAYLRRVGYAGPREPSAAVLAALHAAQVGRIPFENLDVRLGRPVRLDIGALEAKLVRGGRGGYCFEQNALFAAALGALGFAVTPLEARVRPAKPGGPSPRTHMVLRVDLEGSAWLADVGFGGDGPRRPVPFDGALSDQGDAGYRVEPQSDRSRALLRYWRGEWTALYSFSDDPASPADYEVANHYTSTHPRSPFVRGLTVQLTTPSARHFLRGRTYLVREGAEETSRELAEDEVPALLRTVFDLDIPEAEARRALAAPDPVAEPPAGDQPLR